MNKVAILIAAGIGMIATAAPAMAQDYRQRDGRDYEARDGRDYDARDRRDYDARGPRERRSVGGYDINQRENDIRARIQQGIRSGRINQEEQYQLNVMLRSINNLEASYRRNGMTARERSDLTYRLNTVENYIRKFNNNDSYRR